MLNNIACKRLAAAVLTLATKDIKKESKLPIPSPAERDVRNGNCDLWFDILDLKISKEEFIEKSKKGVVK